jgi:hypothetical protein
MATITTTRPVAAIRTRSVVTVSAAATVLGAVVLLAYGAAAIGVLGSMRAGDPGASSTVPLNAGSFAIGVLFSGVLGTVLAAAIARYAKSPALTYLRTSIVLVAVSEFMPLAASHTHLSTKLALAIGHVLAAAVIIPIVTRRLRTV